MNHRFFYRRRVEFADTDVAGIMHFSNFFRFMEVTEHAFYRELGLSVHPFNDEISDSGDSPKVGWPRVHASADYRMPLKFEEEVEVELLIEEIRSKTVCYFFRFWKYPDEPEKRCLAATGRFTVVCVSFDTETRRMKGVAIPDEVREKIETAPRELLEN
ncbi:MAG: thioesterase family protein [Verrucomicrobiales bacterium]|nr:thioesterase family protein [Verrucomicrobiales bacterium]